jgi:hypothetical protein
MELFENNMVFPLVSYYFKNVCSIIIHMKIPFFSTPKSHELAVIIDIGSGVVSGAIVSIPKGSDGLIRPTFFYQTSRTIECHASAACEPLKKSMVHALEAVVDEVSHAHVGVPDRVYVILASPWCLSQTRTTTLKKIMPFKVTPETVVQMVDKEKKLFTADIHDHLGGEYRSPITIETIVLSISCDRKTVYELPKHPISLLELTISMTVVDESVISEIQKALDRGFMGKDVLYHSFMTTSFCVARDLLPGKKNMLLVDIGGEVSDISYGENDVLKQSLSVPFGTHTLIRKAITSEQATIREIKSLVKMHQSNLLHGKVSNRLDHVFDTIGKDWKKHFKNALTHLHVDQSLEVIILFADADIGEWFAEKIREEIKERKIPVILITPLSVYDRYAAAENVSRDIYTIVDALFLGKRNV